MTDRTNNPDLLQGNFSLVKPDQILFKSISTADHGDHDLIEFWVADKDKEVHCVAWDATANALKRALENNPVSEISLTYKHKVNRFTNNVDYSVRRFTI